MASSNLLPSHTCNRLLIIIAGLTAAATNPTFGYTPDSPEVRAVLDRAMAYMQKTPPSVMAKTHVGGPALFGLVAYKYHARYRPADGALPKLTQDALAMASKVARESALLDAQDNYSLGLVLIFLSEVKPSSHLSEIRVYLNQAAKHQQQGGAWGYPSSATGDTSQTQYPILGAWSARNVGVDVPSELVDRAAKWLLRTQDPGGAWGYQGMDPGTYTRVPQAGMRHSLAAAGLGSLYVCADYFGIRNKRAKSKKATESTDLPPALIPVNEVANKSKRKRRATTSMDVGRLQQALADGNAWFDQNFSVQTNQYQFYYLYALERYRSFQELIEGGVEDEPDWYNEGVEYLARVQSKIGSFPSPPNSNVNCEESVATAFASLFLLRSTQATLEKIMDREGVLRGGRGLPSDLSDVRQRGGKIVAPAITGKVEDLIGMLEDDEADQIENLLDNPDALSLSGLDSSGKNYTARLWRVLRTGSYKARIVAARALGRQDDLDNVPILIYALTDGDPRVKRAARDALRAVSRKFDGFALPDQPTKPQLDLAVKQWQDWYRSVRPDAVFVK